MKNTYKIVRFYFNKEKPCEVIKEGISLEKAQAHCRDPETSSKTCSTIEAMERTRIHGPWFDGYEAE